eukprot:scaffold9921_cov79-Skeletonema_dohrnii-CCMP3373.AAC.2
MGHWKQWIATFTACDTIWCDGVSSWDTIWLSTEIQLAVSDASSGHLRRCSYAHASNQCLSREKEASILSWPTIMGHWKQWIATFTACDTIWCDGVSWPSQMPHQVTYDVVATPIRRKNA